MSFMDLNVMTPLAILAQYVAEVKKSVFLTRDELELLNQWLQLSHGDVDSVILILEDTLDRRKRYVKNGTDEMSGKLPSIKALNKTMVSKLSENRNLRS